MVRVNTALTNRTYVVVLKAKQGELLAIQSTDPESFVSLLEVPSSTKATAVARGWPHQEHAVWVHPLNVTGVDDAAWVGDVERTFEILRDEGVCAVPVVATSEDADVLGVVGRVIARDKRGLVIRIDCEDALEAGREGLTSDIDDVLIACSIAAADCDLVVDAGLVDGGPAVQSSVASAALTNLPRMAEWRSIVVAFSAFPEVVGSVVAPGTVGSIPRTDAASFAHLASSWRTRPLTYADYGVGVPTYADTRWAPIPNIRYALPGEWKVHRAHQKRSPSAQYVALARDLAAADYFAGAGLSAGDAYVADVASGAGGPGNAGSYLKAAMSRHFAVVLDSLATHGVP